MAGKLLGGKKPVINDALTYIDDELTTKRQELLGRPMPLPPNRLRRKLFDQVNNPDHHPARAALGRPP